MRLRCIPRETCAAASTMDYRDSTAYTGAFGPDRPSRIAFAGGAIPSVIFDSSLLILDLSLIHI